MAFEEYGPLAYLIGTWSSGDDWVGENRAPDPDRNEENTKFRQESWFEPIDPVENHEQVLYPLRYRTMAWEEGDDDPFHEEVGYWIWDPDRNLVMKSFIVPRGISVNAGGKVSSDWTKLVLEATVGNEVYGISSNEFLDQEFKTIKYNLEVTRLDEDTYSYQEDSQLLIKGQKEVFHHTEKNTLRRTR